MTAITSTFKSGEPSLPDILRDINSGKVQLPDFQRGWVWDDDHIASLIASISLSYPIGAVMLLQTGGDGVQFHPRPIQGVTVQNDLKPEYLILDGQQRMTSLYLAMSSGQPVPTTTNKGKEIERYYYLDIVKSLNPNEDRLDAVLSIPTTKQITSDFGRKIDLDLTTQENEFSQCYFPLGVIFDQNAYSAWRRGFQKMFRNDDGKLDLFDNFEAEVVNRFQSYRIPTIELLRDTPKEAVCQVFEKVNMGGVTLTVFELVTAMFAADNYNLREDWDKRKERVSEQNVLKGMDSTAFLTAVTLLSTFQVNQQDSTKPVTCKRKNVLKLTLEEYKRNADTVEDGLRKAARFLAREKIFDSRTLPYSTQLIPLSVICALLGDRFEIDTIRRRLAQWFWCGVFGELYGGANETRFSLDVPDFMEWIEDQRQPRTIRDASFAPTRLLSMQSRLSAAYKGLMALLMQAGSNDFLSGDPIEITSYFDLAIDIHHIFPKAYCESKYKRSLWNSSVNKAPLSAKTNRIIGGKAPSVYLTNIEKQSNMESSRLDNILTTHKIDPDLLRVDAFEKFIRDRAANLLGLIEAATGKGISGRDSEEVIHEYGAALR
ncbi:DUF262 domain-containing protein [candidate division CSSED10-310 bacterium]|uniref:DUF262 domain-containing protein n=1 Tax=candidate division CSSED10-310 bacterium TaxID=2855610 RepID=A0ABV6YYT6_UNCC1